MAEATRTEEQTREALIQETLRGVVEGTTKEESIAPTKDAELPLGKDDTMTVKTITSAGYVYVWDTRTYEKIPILYYMLPRKMRERRPDGSYRFTTTNPGKSPFRGTIKCMLHKDDPSRKHFDELGFRYCTKENLTNPYQRERHMRLKHPREWESIDNERKEKERLEDRKLQQAILERVAEPKQAVAKEFTCDVCGKKVSSPIALAGHKRSHK